nr:hypothetical protein [Tanacetum cinerariifolium]
MVTTLTLRNSWITSKQGCKSRRAKIKFIVVVVAGAGDGVGAICYRRRVIGGIVRGMVDPVLVKVSRITMTGTSVTPGLVPVPSSVPIRFDIDALIRTMNYEPIVIGTQSNGFAGIKSSDNAGKARKETEPVKYYILLPLWIVDLPFSQDPKSYHDDGSKPSSDNDNKFDEDPRNENKCIDQEKEDNVNSTNDVNVVSANKDNELPFDPNMLALEDVGILNFSSDDEDDSAMADMNNLDTTNPSQSYFNYMNS